MKRIVLLFCFLPKLLFAQSAYNSFVEIGTSIHGGNNVPLWQVSNQHGLSSLNNNSYIRTAFFYADTCKNWKFNTGIDLAALNGFTSSFVVQQAFADIKYKWIGMSIGSKESGSELLNLDLSGGGLTWSGNARPIPQVRLGILDYTRLTSWAQVKAEMSYGKWTDNAYQENKVGSSFWYTKDILYHHKSFYFRLGKDSSHWLFDLGMRLDTQFGGYKIGGTDEGDLGNSLKDYWRVFVPQGGGDSSPEGQKYFQGNFVGSEHLKLTYKFSQCSLSVYLENYYDDFSGMGKLNGLDGLWGLEYKSRKKQAINGLVLEYYQTTNQSGPLHGIDNSIVKKTGGADNYYNNVWYPGWVHWGMNMANPLVASPIYNTDGDMTFKYNRIKAFHLGWKGDINSNLSYRAKLSYNQTWGTPFVPIVDIRENFSTFAEVIYFPRKFKGWRVAFSGAFDIGQIYGNNVGMQMKIKKYFK